MDPAFSAAEKIYDAEAPEAIGSDVVAAAPNWAKQTRDAWIRRNAAIIRAEYAEQAKELKRLLDVAGDIHSMARDLGEDLGALTVEEY